MSDTHEKEAAQTANSAAEDRGRSRMAKAVQKLRREAARTLARETPHRRNVTIPPRRDVVPPAMTDGLNEAERMTLVEVTDADGRPLVCMTPENALRQNLGLRLAAVVLRTRQNKAILRRRRDERLGSAGAWDIYTGFVLVGEAREDAAVRLLETLAVIGGLQTGHVAEREGERNPLSLFAADLPAGVYPSHPAQALMEADADELRGLVRDAPELLTPELIWAESTGMMFHAFRE